MISDYITRTYKISDYNNNDYYYKLTEDDGGLTLTYVDNCIDDYTSSMFISSFVAENLITVLQEYLNIQRSLGHHVNEDET